MVYAFNVGLCVPPVALDLFFELNFDGISLTFVHEMPDLVKWLARDDIGDCCNDFRFNVVASKDTRCQNIGLLRSKVQDIGFWSDECPLWLYFHCNQLSICCAWFDHSVAKMIVDLGPHLCIRTAFSRRVWDTAGNFCLSHCLLFLIVPNGTEKKIGLACTLRHFDSRRNVSTATGFRLLASTVYTNIPWTFTSIKHVSHHTGRKHMSENCI